MATFAYDSVNQRVSMSLCFAAPGIYRASVYCGPVLLLHGQFDCIVLTGNCLSAPARQHVTVLCQRTTYLGFAKEL